MRPYAAQAPSNRTIHLVDVENLLEGTRFDASDVASLERRYRQGATVSRADLIVIASSHATAEATWFGWSSTRRLLRSGPSGADLALVDVIAREDLSGRFGRVVVGSGDGIFAEPCAGLQAAGCSVSVVARRPASLSRRLAFAVRDVVFLEPEGRALSVGLRLAG